MKNIKLVITDIDGVWTDGGMYYDKHGNEWKKFNTSDSAGVIFLRLSEIPLAIITGEDTEIVKRRADKLKIDLLYMGVRDKLSVARQICTEMKVSLSDEVAYIGDDINDIPLLENVAFSATPANAPEYVQKHAKTVLSKSGGNGAFREFIEIILKSEGKLDRAIELFLKGLSG